MERLLNRERVKKDDLFSAEGIWWDEIDIKQPDGSIITKVCEKHRNTLVEGFTRAVVGHLFPGKSCLDGLCKGFCLLQIRC